MGGEETGDPQLPAEPHSASTARRGSMLTQGMLSCPTTDTANCKEHHNSNNAGRRTSSGNRRPILLDELDADLMKLIRQYYRRKKDSDGGMAASGVSPPRLGGGLDGDGSEGGAELNSTLRESLRSATQRVSHSSTLPTSTSSSVFGDHSEEETQEAFLQAVSPPHMLLRESAALSLSSSSSLSAPADQPSRTRRSVEQQQQSQGYGGATPMANSGGLLYHHHSNAAGGGGVPMSSAAIASGNHQDWGDGLGVGGGGGNAEASRPTRHTLTGFPTYSPTSFVRAYVSESNLSLKPAMIVSCLAALFNITAFYFLENHILDTRDHLGLFLIGSYLVFSSYYLIYYFLEKFSTSFRRIHSHDKKFYIIGNLLKAGVLISIMPFAVYHLVKIIVFHEWMGAALKNLGCIYTLPDFVSMVVVKRMRWSTWIHHLCVVLFNYFSVMNDYQEENVLRCVVVYASFSSFAYCVNVLLASRFLGISLAAARILSFLALFIYAGCCIINWCWQVYYLHRLLSTGHYHWSVGAYMALICLVMYDDMVLNQWLLRYAKSTAFAAAAAQRRM